MRCFVSWLDKILNRYLAVIIVTIGFNVPLPRFLPLHRVLGFRIHPVHKWGNEPNSFLNHLRFLYHHRKPIKTCTKLRILSGITVPAYSVIPSSTYLTTTLYCHVVPKKTSNSNPTAVAFQQNKITKMFT